MSQIRTIINPDYASLSSFLNSVPHIYDYQGTLLHLARNSVKSFDVDGRRLIVKRYHKPNFFVQIRYFFTGICKAKKAYDFSKKFQERGLDTPTALSYTVIAPKRWLQHSYLVTEECTGTSVMQTSHNRMCPQELVDALGAFLAYTHQRGVLHGDLNLSNIYYKKDADGRFQFSYIDINRTKYRSNPSMRACANNMARVTHDAQLYRRICYAYAAARNWDKEQFTKMAIQALNRFESKKAFLAKFKSKKKRRRI